MLDPSRRGFTYMGKPGSCARLAQTSIRLGQPARARHHHVVENGDARRRAASSARDACPCSPLQTRRRTRSTAVPQARRAPGGCRPRRWTRAPAAWRHRIDQPDASDAAKQTTASRSTSMSSPPLLGIRAHRDPGRRSDQPIDVLVALELEQLIARVPRSRFGDVDRHRHETIRGQSRHRLLRCDDGNLVLHRPAAEEDTDAETLRHDRRLPRRSEHDDLPLEIDAEPLVHRVVRDADQRQHVGCGCVVDVDDEIGVLRRDLRTTGSAVLSGLPPRSAGPPCPPADS